jgi:hypothetical protein
MSLMAASGSYPGVAGFPGSTTTGYRNAPGYTGSLADGTGTTVTSSTTYNHLDFPGGLSIGTSGSPVTSVTFSGCRFHGGSQQSLVQLHGDGITFSYCSVEPAVSAPPVTYANSYEYGIQGDGGYSTSIGALTVQYCDIWGFGDAISTTGSTQAKPHVFQYNWIHDAAADGGIYHTDGIGDLASGTTYDSYVVISGNTIMSAGNTQGIAYEGGASPGNFDHFQVTNNLISGWGYSLNVYGGSGGSTAYMDISGNTFSTLLLPVYGPLYNSAGLSGYSAPWQWRYNRWYVPPGAAWGHPAYSGYYWLPGTTSSASPSLDEVAAGLAGLSDYAG